MLLRRFYHEGLAQASYLVGCQATGEAAVIDPNRAIDQYLEAAERDWRRPSARGCASPRSPTERR